MIQFHVFPGGKKRVVTFSYDDGEPDDARLIELFDRYGVKATFHLNGGKFKDTTAAERATLRERYRGHEVAGHSLHHGWPSRMPPASLVGEVYEERKLLEEIAGYPVTGFSYPSGSYNGEVEAVLRACGIDYARTVKSTNGFGLPEDFLAWHPSCHHNHAAPLVDRFLADLDSEWRGPLFYIWGHAHDLWNEEQWTALEEVVKRLSGNDKIWYATNREIYDYMTAARQLRISADETVFYNPTAQPIWVERNKTEILCIPAGETVRFAPVER